MREVIFDTETTGLDPLDGHRICEIGCVELVNRIPTGRTFHAYLNPCRTMPAEAQAVHGLSDAFLSGKPVFAAVVRDLLAFFGEARLIAQNAVFDCRFVNWELRNCGEAQLAADRVDCTLVLARKTFPGAKHSLDALCNRFGIDLSARDKHGALLDAQLLADVYIELTGGRQIGLSLVDETPDAPVVVVEAERRQWPPRPHAPSDAERARHARFLESLSGPLWQQLGSGSVA